MDEMAERVIRILTEPGLSISRAVSKIIGCGFRDMKLRKIQQEFFVVVAMVNEVEDLDAIDAIARVQENFRRAVLLEVRRNTSQQRTGIVVAVHLESVQKFVLSLVKTAFSVLKPDNLSDEMSSPGMVDSIAVIPLLISNLPMATLMVNDIAEKLTQTFEIPIYYFGKNAPEPQREDIRFYRQWNLRDFRESHTVQPDLGNQFRRAETGGILLGSRLYYLTFALFLDSDELEMVREFLKAYTDYTIIPGCPKKSGK